MSEVGRAAGHRQGDLPDGDIPGMRAPVDPLATLPVVNRFMVLETSSGMFRLRISFGVLETLSQSMATSGEEVTGLLLGRVRVTDVVEATIEGFTPLVVRQGFVLEGEFSGVERESGRKTEGPPTNLAHGAVGFFRARTAALDQQDRSLLEALLQSSSIAVICLPTEADCMCHVY